jgi:hypothetical protein
MRADKAAEQIHDDRNTAKTDTKAHNTVAWLHEDAKRVAESALHEVLTSSLPACLSQGCISSPHWQSAGAAAHSLVDFNSLTTRAEHRWDGMHIHLCLYAGTPAFAWLYIIVSSSV